MDSDHQTGAAIEISGLTKDFGDFRAVDGIDLTVQQGELFSILGPNGAGKTTTIKMLCCLLRPTSGTALVMGHDIQNDPLAVKRIIDVSPQETAIAEHLNAWENLSLMAGLHGYGKQETRRRSEELLELLALTQRANDRVKKYSGGMKRRLSIAMALVTKPLVLFLDEPTIGLDPQSRRGMWDHIAGLKGDTTIVLTTHYLEESDALADRIAVIDSGKVVALGTASELKAGVSGSGVMVVEATGITEQAIADLRRAYSNVRVADNRIEIDAPGVTVYEVQDILRPLGVVVEATYRKHVTLDDVFLDLTGEEIRQ